MSAEPQRIIGRDPELRRIDEFLDAIQAGPIALVLEGEIGIGKTALWKQGLAAAVARSHRVLSCRPIDTEAQLAYAAGMRPGRRSSRWCRPCAAGRWSGHAAEQRALGWWGESRASHLPHRRVAHRRAG